MERREHWDTIYRSKADSDLSWFQQQPAVSLSLIDSLLPRPRTVLDVGGGQSALGFALADRGFEAVTVLDISQAAIERARARNGSHAGRVRWVVGDILDAPDLGIFDLWHDRAVFHFLTEADDRIRYLRAVLRTVAPQGHVVVATFAPTGPEKCSGLPVRRYSAQSLAQEFGPSFPMVTSRSEVHTTPWGKTQDFTYVVMRLDAGDAGRPLLRS